QHALELDEGLLVEDDVVDVRERDAPLLQDEVDGETREPGVVLDAAEALLLRGRDQLAVLHQGGRGVVVVGGEPEDGHQSCLRAAASVSLSACQAAQLPSLRGFMRSGSAASWYSSAKGPRTTK